MTAIFEAREITRHYDVRRGWFRAAQPLRAVDGISFRLAKATTLAVVGESGCGKSTLARVLALLEPASSGTLLVDGKAPGAIDRRLLRRSIQMVFQNPYGSLHPRYTAGQTLEEPLVINEALSRAERRQAALAMLDRVGLRPEHYGRYPHMLSGGQRQRVAIARALMLRPRIVVADEPVSALDVSIQAQILNLLRDLQDEFGLAYLFISHDLGVVRHMADALLVMYLGRAAEQGDAAAIFAHPRHPYTKALLASIPGLTQASTASVQARGEFPSPLDPPSGCVFRTRCPQATPRCAQQRPELRSSGWPIGRLPLCRTGVICAVRLGQLGLAV